MKISEMMERLAKVRDEHGDLDMWVYDNACAGHYGCEPYQPVDASEGVVAHTNQDGDVVALIESQW